MSTPVVRFAPSPTGILHVGGARTAIFNYFFAKRFGGKFILRIEDTDLERSKPEHEVEILESMKWLGLSWDEGPIRQTSRFDRYRSVAQELLAAGKAYRCYATTEELEEMRKNGHGYDRRWRDHKGPYPERPFVVRFKAPMTGKTVVNDLIHGKIEFDNAESDDFVILRSDVKAAPIYNFAVVVDDVDMKVTHVIRGDDHLSNTPKQVRLMEALNFTVPAFAHVPMILGADKQKLSKRHGATGVSQFKKDGYLREAMVNYLVRLGWGHGDQELFTFDDLSKVFDLSGCGSSPAVFDRAKLDWVNSHYLRQKSKAEIAALVKESTGVDLAPLFAGANGDRLFAAACERAVKVPDFATQLQWALGDPKEYDAKAKAQALDTRKPGVLEAFTGKLSALSASDFESEERLKEIIHTTVTETGAKMPDVMKPARVLLTGALSGPDVSLMMAVLGKEATLRRLQKT